LDFETLSTTDSQSSLGSQEKSVARDFYEYAVIFSIDLEDKVSFQRYLSSLRPIYTIKR